MRAVDVIQAKRDGRALTKEQIEFFVDGATSQTLPDYQVSALLMAIVIRGMNAEETAWLTDAMVRSGARVDLSHIPGLKVDKHSTGGVGDKISVVLAPLAAACGVVVPMMSGRGLGHTGGTLDKLEAIPGFRVRLSLEEFREALVSVGCCLIGQTDEIAPADRRLYALRDVTGTVESIPLISASIMSKKIAEGIDALVLDVKVGRGAFMPTEEQARALAHSLVSIGGAAGVATEATLSAMDVPLGRAVGNALEIVESIQTLQGRGPSDVEDLSVWFAARMMVRAGVARSTAEGESLARRALVSGRALEKFRQIVERQGGDPRVIDDERRLPMAASRATVRSPRAGWLTVLDAGLVGRASVALGAGRDRVDGVIDPAAGILVLARPGDAVSAGDAVLELHYGSTARLEEAQHLAESAIIVGDEPPAASPLILGTIGCG
jgi:pyrimidine-nucleoside phosphorylase